jgi:hypothetical protein
VREDALHRRRKIVFAGDVVLVEHAARDVARHASSRPAR